MLSASIISVLLGAATLGAAVSTHGGCALTTAAHDRTCTSDVQKFELRRKQATRASNSTLLESLQLNGKWISAGGYFIDLAVGTPPQQLEVLVDTGSSNLFFPSSQAQPCLEYQCPGGSFSAADSTTLTIDEGRIFNIAYVDGSLVSGNYSQDTLSMGNAMLSNFTFAIANEIQVSPGQPRGAQYGILGVSGRGQETDACSGENPGCPGGFLIPTIHDALYSAGYTKSRSFSLYLDSVEEQKGSILFGGVDTAKFVGPLTTLAVQPDISGDAQNGTYVGQDLMLTSVAGVFGGQAVPLTGGTNFSGVTATIDSGAAKMGLPAAAFSALGDQVPNAFYDADGQLLIPCDYANSNDSLFLNLAGYDGLGSVTVEVPASNLVVPYFGQNYNSTTPDVVNGTQMCELGVQSGSGGLLLGDPFIRSIYINYNLDQHTISIAQASYNTDESNIVAIGSGPVPPLNGTGADNTPNTPNVTSAPPTASLQPYSPSATIQPYTGGAAPTDNRAGMFFGLAVGVLTVAAML